jgi:16S rRNA (cytosine967-C5)-methyltransferase
MFSREAAYLALLSSLREEEYLQDFLNRWIEEEKPSQKDAGLAREIAYGAAKMALTLDYIAGSLSLKRKERALLRTALYQRYFLDRVPEYALVNESVEIAKKHCSTHFAKFLNALLRKREEVSLPEDEAIRYSYPPYFVQKLINQRGQERAIEIMKIGNRAPVLMAVKLSEQEVVRLQGVTNSSEYYIQNETPFHLMQKLKGGEPKRVLDLCSSPGGKLIAAHHLFPKAKLFANDVSQAKIDRLKENLQKYGIEAALSVGLGEAFPTNEKFDLILLDVPCSNSGVLRKRPEARWRLSEQQLFQLHQTQERLFEHALKLCSGEIWYMTCSILREENEEFIEAMVKKHSLKVRTMHAFLPNEEGADGGFGCAVEV